MPKFNIYGLLIGIGVVVAMETSRRVAKVRGINNKIIEKAFWWIIIGGVIGARIYHVIDLWQYYSQNLIETFYLWNGGLGIWGAIIGGVLGLILFCLKTPTSEVGFLSLLDVIVVGVPLAQAIGRLGNFFNRELYGKVTNLPWGIYIKETNRYHHPLFAYEAILNLILFATLWKLTSIKKISLTGIYLIGYGMIRASLEWLRPEDIVWSIGSLPVAVIISLTSFLIGMVLIYQKRS